MKRNNQPSAVILAAGQSERMGFPKAMLPFDGRQTFLEQLIHAYRAAGCGEIVVVVNPELHSHLHEWVEQGKGKVTFMVNHRFERGRLSSVQCGLRTICRPGFVFLQDVDRPGIDPATLHAIYKRRGATGYTASTFDGQSGHPVLLSPEAWRQALSAPCTTNLRHLLRHFQKTTVPVADPAVLVNINTMEDYKRHFSNTPNATVN